MKKLCFSRSLRVIKSIKSIKVVFILFLSSIVLERTNENRKQLKRPKINKKIKGAKKIHHSNKDYLLEAKLSC